MLEHVDDLLKLAKEAHGEEIRPCLLYPSFEQCINIFNERITLWYNTPDDNTHLVSIPIPVKGA